MGNCLFDSLNYYLKENNSYALRCKIVQFIQNHPKLFEPDILHSGFPNVEQYCQIMKVNGRDGDGIALQACVLLYNIKVILHFNGIKNKVLTLFENLSGKTNGDELTTEMSNIREIHICYHPGHFSVYRS